MNLTNQHKALLITFFMAGTVVLSVFNFSLIKQQENVAESYYEMEPEEELTEEELKILEAIEKLNASKAETNNAFNETQQSKQFAQAYKPIAPPEDYQYPKSSSEDAGDNAYEAKKIEPLDPGIDKDKLSSFDKVNDLLKKQHEDVNNARSTISFSLRDRTKIHIPIPVYLCEVDGKIVVNITVNAKGSVTDAYVNTSSNSSNECLIEHALEYAKESIFSAHPSKPSQLGSITFYFIGKH